jgi:hypothetical protein
LTTVAIVIVGSGGRGAAIRLESHGVEFIRNRGRRQ